MNEKIKILHIVNHLTLTGMEYGVIKLLNGLDDNVFEKYICVLSTAYADAMEVVSRNVTVVELKKKPGFDLSIIRKIALFSKLHNIQIMHSHNWASFPYAVLAKLWIKSTLLIHGEHGRETPQWKLTSLQKIFILTFKNRIYRYTTVAQHLAEDVHKIWGVNRNKIIVIANGVDVDKFYPMHNKQEAKLKFAIDSGAIVVTTIAGFRAIKDHVTIFKAVGELSKSIKNIVLLVIGTGRDKATITNMENIAKQHCNSVEVRFLGNRKDIPAILNATDYYINSSLYEGMSNTLLEAMASKTLVLASDIIGNKEIIGATKHNIIFKTGDFMDLFQKLHKLVLNEPLKQCIINEQYEHVEKLYSSKRYILQYSAFYQKIMAELKCPLN